MSTLNKQGSYPVRWETAALPRWLLVSGWTAVLGSVVLAARLTWEQTLLTWSYGPQMVGFSLAHGSGVFLLFFPLVLVAWLLASIGFLGFSFSRKRRPPSTSLLLMVLSLAVLLSLFLPYGFWQRLFAGRLADGPYVGEFMTYASAAGDLSTVRALVSHGASVNSRNREGKTGLHAAAVSGQLAVVEYLVANGADPNLLDRFGDSAMEIAASENHMELAKFLADHGGRRVRGDEALRQKSSEEIVHEDIEKMEHQRKR